MMAHILIVMGIWWLFVALVICAVSLGARRKQPPRRPPSVMRVDGSTAYVCAWCDYQDGGAKWANANGLMASHGICPMHKQQQLSSQI